MDKEALTSNIKNIDLKIQMFKIIDKALSVMKNHSIKTSVFLNPHELKNAMNILNNFPEIVYSIHGGYEGAERNIITIAPHYIDDSDIECFTRIFKINGNFKFKVVSHKDYLGSMLALGIKREKIGDILVNESCAYVIVLDDISDFIKLNLEKVANNRVTVEEVSECDLIIEENQYKIINCTVSSLRLDCCISSIYNLSRVESSKYITSEKVYIDYEIINNSSKNIKLGNLISVRGKGRAYISEIGEATKKGKVKLSAKILV